MDFTIFDHSEHMTALSWLGKKDWLIYQDIPDKRAVSAKPKKLLLKPKKPPENFSDTIVVSEKEYNRYPQEMWKVLREIFNVLDYDVIGTLWYHTLAKALADGPKIFRPTPEQCEALQHAEARYSFDDYKQPFPVITLEIPEEYRNQLKEKYGIDDCPKYVLINHDEKNKFITVSAFYNISNIITHITPNRKEYETIEESLIYGRNRRSDENVGIEGEFDAAENVQRLGINFCMMMSLYTVKVVGPIDANDYKTWEADAKGKNPNGLPNNRAVDAQKKLAATMKLIQFNQQVEFYDEIEEPVEVGQGVDIEKLHKSPRTHWRRGHFAMQPCGVGLRERKMIFRKAVLIRAKYFIGEMKDTSVTYTIRPGHKSSPPEKPLEEKSLPVQIGQSIEVVRIEDSPIKTGVVGAVQKVASLGSNIHRIDVLTAEGFKFSLIVPPDEFRII